ncbi:MAG: hypothetical protein PHE84_11730 [bacterium]|nr:hypothetical protein [bacterium]
MNADELALLMQKSILNLTDIFRKTPNYFFTEYDIICYFYYLLQNSLKYHPVSDKNNKKQFLVHLEYPTPFRCDIGENRFQIKTDTDKTPSGGLFQRGYYDLIVLNPNFVKANSYDLITAHDYQDFQKNALPQTGEIDPLIVYGLEFMYQREPFKSVNDMNVFVKKVIQDADKLATSRDFLNRKFMRNIRMLAFVKDRENGLLKEKLSFRPEIMLQFAE